MGISKQDQPKQYEAFLFYVDDWLSSPNVALLSLEEEGAYLNLLLRAWKQSDCGLPDDDAVLAAWSKLGAAKWRKSQLKLRALFETHGGRLYNPRLMRERENQIQYWQERNDRHEAIRVKRAEAGKAGADKRWGMRPDEPESGDGKMANAIFANGKPIANAIANGMAKNSLSKSESKSYKNLSGDTGAQEYPREPEHGPPADPPPLHDPDPPQPDPTRPLSRNRFVGQSTPILVATRQLGPQGMLKPTRLEIPGKPADDAQRIARELSSATDGRMQPREPDADLVEFLLAEAAQAGAGADQVIAAIRDVVKRQRRTSSRWRPASWGYFRVVIPPKLRQQTRAG